MNLWGTFQNQAVELAKSMSVLPSQVWSTVCWNCAVRVTRISSGYPLCRSEDNLLSQFSLSTRRAWLSSPFTYCAVSSAPEPGFFSEKYLILFDMYVLPACIYVHRVNAVHMGAEERTLDALDLEPQMLAAVN